MYNVWQGLTAWERHGECAAGLREPMDYEVELKFRIDDPARVAALLAGLEATPGEIEEHRDSYRCPVGQWYGVTSDSYPMPKTRVPSVNTPTPCSSSNAAEKQIVALGLSYRYVDSRI
jgi:hypothetical protein